jgi:hypothetical protein
MIVTGQPWERYEAQAEAERDLDQVLAEIARGGRRPELVLKQCLRWQELRVKSYCPRHDPDRQRKR